MWHNLLTANFIGNRHWVLTKPLTYEIPNFIGMNSLKTWQGIVPTIQINNQRLLITVPKGFNTDLASIARPMWSIISPWDVARAAVVHDMLYGYIRSNKDKFSKRRINMLRHHADDIFRQGMRDADPEIPKWKIQICYYFVRSLGWASMIKAAKFKN
jgi:hypothetical protein|tara:strand:+ start:241 stop:711 length:471 start_codon:yes stop_codon:yes gene_type:complete